MKNTTKTGNNAAKGGAKPDAPAGSARELAILQKRLAESQRVAAIGSFERDLATGEGFWSEELYRLLGFTPGQVENVRSVFISRLHPDDRAGAMAALARVSGHGGAFNMEVRYLTQDGHVRHARFRAVAETGDDGAPVRLYGTFQDITEAKSVREELSRGQERYKSLVENASAVIHTLDASGRITYVSPNIAAHTGQTDVSLVGKSLAELACERDRADVSAYIARVWEQGRDPAGVEFRWKREGGGFVWFETTASRLDKDAILAVARDCTGRKLAEEARRDMELMLRHDMRSPLQGVIQLPETMLDDDNLSDQQRHQLRVVSNCGRRMLRLIDFSMTLSKLEAGVFVPVVEAVDIVAVCREIAAEMAPRAKARGVEIVFASEGGGLLPDEGLLVKGDATLCFILFENLIANALDASPRGAAVTVSFRRLEKTALAAIHNPGAVPGEVRGRFFEKYATHGKPGGTGLGAYSAKLIAERLRGTVTLRTSETEGTTLAVSLPL